MPIPTELFATIAARFTPDNGTATVAAALRVWNTLFDRLALLIGPLGTQLLFTRSMAIQASAFPWLPQPPAGAQQQAFELFERCLHDLAPEDLLTVNLALLGTFTTVLADLIGERLATRQLRLAFPGDEADKNSWRRRHDQ
jgi:hypothetical protein